MESIYYLVCYDITENKSRYQLDKLLKGFGVRIQRSVYLCKLTTEQQEQLTSKLRHYIRTKGKVTTEISIDMVRICHSCWKTHMLYGNVQRQKLDSNIVL